jgi:hypothetical protein
MGGLIHGKVPAGPGQSGGTQATHATALMIRSRISEEKRVARRCGEPDGPWEEYDESGHLRSVTRWANGKVVRDASWAPPADGPSGGDRRVLRHPGTTETPPGGSARPRPRNPTGARSLLGSVHGGAAEGYGRMTGRLALTLLHLGRAECMGGGRE